MATVIIDGVAFEVADEEEIEAEVGLTNEELALIPGHMAFLDSINIPDDGYGRVLPYNLQDDVPA